MIFRDLLLTLHKLSKKKNFFDLFKKYYDNFIAIGLGFLETTKMYIIVGLLVGMCSCKYTMAFNLIF